MIITRDFVEKFLKELHNAWIRADLLSIKFLFEKTTEYCETPFHKPATNISEILDLWKDVSSQVIKQLEFHILAIDGNTAVIRWIFQRDGAGKFDGIYLMKFDKNGNCISFMTWEMENSQ